MKRNFSRIRDAVLNDPFHQGGVQVARHHLRLPLGLARGLGWIGGAWGRETELLLQLPFDGNDRRDINAERQLEVQAWLNLLEIFAEALHDGDEVARHGVVGRPNGQGDQSNDARAMVLRAGHRWASSA